MTFYAYVYADPRTGVPFYVGKGQGRRARKHLVQTTNRGMAARLAELREVGLEPLISVYGCDSEAHALELERVLIDAYGRQCDGSGSLVNILEAGDRSGGFAGRRHSEETKARIRAAMQARRLTVEHRARVTEWARSPRGRAVRSAAASKRNAEYHARRR